MLHTTIQAFIALRRRLSRSWLVADLSEPPRVGEWTWHDLERPAPPGRQPPPSVAFNAEPVDSDGQDPGG